MTESRSIALLAESMLARGATRNDAELVMHEGTFYRVRVTLEEIPTDQLVEEVDDYIRMVKARKGN